MSTTYIAIPSLPPATTPLSGAEMLEAVQAGISVRVTAAQIAALSVGLTTTLPAASSPLTGAELVSGVRVSTSVRMTTTQIATLASVQIPSLDVRAYGVTMNGTTDDTVAATAAVAAAALAVRPLYWPPGTALTTASIPLLHTVRHVGPGRIKRGANIFVMQPKPTLGTGTINHFFVAPTGNTTNDGLSANEPMASQTAVSSLINYGDVLQATWQIDFAAGANASFLMTNIRSVNAVRFVGVPTGDFRTVPTSMVTKAASGSAANGMAFTQWVNVLVKDMLVKDFTGSFEAGMLVSTHSIAVIENVHATNCDIGWSFNNYAIYHAKGGTISFCLSYGVFELFTVIRDFRYAGSHTNGTYINNNLAGFFVKELCTGHCDYIEFNDNYQGMFMSRGSTANISATVWRRNTICVAVQAGSKVGYDGTQNFNAGTVDANVIQVLPLDTDIIDIYNNGETYTSRPYVGQVLKTRAYKLLSSSLTGTTVLTAMFYPLLGFQPGAFQAENSIVRFKATGSCSLVANTGGVFFRVGSGTLSNFTLPIGAIYWDFEVDYVITTTGDFQRVISRLSYISVPGAAATVMISTATRTIAHSTLALEFGLWGQLADATDSITANTAQTWTTVM